MKSIIQMARLRLCRLNCQPYSKLRKRCTTKKSTNVIQRVVAESPLISMSPTELSNAISNAQETLAKVDKILHGTLITVLTNVVNKFDSARLQPIIKLIAVLAPDTATEDELTAAFDLFKADLNAAQQVDLAAISQAGEWLKNHPLILRFVANHFTKGTDSGTQVLEMPEDV